MRDVYLTRTELIERWRGTPHEVTKKTLANWSAEKTPRGPPCRRIGSRVFYALKDIEHFEETGQHWAELTHERSSARAAAPPQSGAENAGGSHLDAGSRVRELTAELRKAERLGIHLRRQLERLTGREMLRGTGARRVDGPFAAALAGPGSPRGAE